MRVRFSALALMIVLTGACSTEQPSPPGPTGRPTFVLPTQKPADDCHPVYTVTLNVRAQTLAELPYLNQIKACTNKAGTELLLRNTGYVVWTPRTTTTRQAGVRVNKDTLRAQSFRAVFADRDFMLLPDTDVVISAPPSQVEWTLEPALSAAWQAHDHVADLLVQFGQDQLKDALSGNSPRRRAFATCMLSGYNGYEKAGTLTSGSPTEALLAGWGLATGTTECARAWRNADQADALKNFKTVTWERELVTMRQDTKWMGQIDNLLTLVQRAGRAIAVVH